MAWLTWLTNKARCWAIEMWTFCRFLVELEAGALFTNYIGTRSGGLSIQAMYDNLLDGMRWNTNMDTTCMWWWILHVCDGIMAAASQVSQVEKSQTDCDSHTIQVRIAWLTRLKNKATCWATEMWTFCPFGYQDGPLFTPHASIKNRVPDIQALYCVNIQMMSVLTLASLKIGASCVLLISCSLHQDSNQSPSPWLFQTNPGPDTKSMAIPYNTSNCVLCYCVNLQMTSVLTLASLKIGATCFSYISRPLNFPLLGLIKISSRLGLPGTKKKNIIF